MTRPVALLIRAIVALTPLTWWSMSIDISCIRHHHYRRRVHITQVLTYPHSISSIFDVSSENCPVWRVKGGYTGQKRKRGGVLRRRTNGWCGAWIYFYMVSPARTFSSANSADLSFWCTVDLYWSLSRKWGGLLPSDTSADTCMYDYASHSRIIHHIEHEQWMQTKDYHTLFGNEEIRTTNKDIVL